MLFAGWEGRIVKNCDRGLENAARGRRTAFSSPRSQFFTIRTDPKPANSLFIFSCDKWALCSWGHVTTIFLKIFYIMDYNLKNARNGNSISKIPKWQSLRSLSLKNEIL